MRGADALVQQSNHQRVRTQLFLGGEDLPGLVGCIGAFCIHYVVELMHSSLDGTLLSVDTQ